MIPQYWNEFQDFHLNPVIEPPRFEWLIADPTVLTPSETPDGKWRLWANSLRGIHHYLSDDGYGWEKAQEGPLFGGLRPFVRREGDDFYMFWERFKSARCSVVAVRKSHDLYNWSDPVDLLEPCFHWEGKYFRTNGNPCLLKGQFGYRLYYSAATVFLWDCLFPEPRFIGVAESDSIMGPYRKRPEPILSPSPDLPYRNFGAGAIKVYLDQGNFVGLNNGIYKDKRGHSRSAIMLLKSEDGLNWEQAKNEPILKPEPFSWKRAFVYQLDVVRYKNELRLYYNARDGWFIGRECIGVAVSQIE